MIWRIDNSMDDNKMITLGQNSIMANFEKNRRHIKGYVWDYRILA